MGKEREEDDLLVTRDEYKSNSTIQETGTEKLNSLLLLFAPDLP